MGIRFSYTDESGVTHANAYLRIEHCQIFKRQKRAFFWYNVYHTKTAADEGKKPLDTPSFRSVEASNLAATENEVAHPDYDDYFSNAALLGDTKSPEKNFYVWLVVRHPEIAQNGVEV